MTKQIKSRGRALLSGEQRDILARLRAGESFVTDRVTPVQSLRPKPVRRATMDRLEADGYVRQDHDHFSVNGSGVWRYTITIKGLEALHGA